MNPGRAGNLVVLPGFGVVEGSGLLKRGAVALPIPLRNIPSVVGPLLAQCNTARSFLDLFSGCAVVLACLRNPHRSIAAERLEHVRDRVADAGLNDRCLAAF